MENRFLKKKFYQLILALVLSFTFIFLGIQGLVVWQIRKMEALFTVLPKKPYKIAVKELTNNHTSSILTSHKTIYLITLFNRYANEEKWQFAINTLDKLIKLHMQNRNIRDIAKIHKASIMLNDTDKFTIKDVNQTLDLKLTSPFYYHAQMLKIQSFIAYDKIAEAQETVRIFLESDKKLPQDFVNFLHNADYALNYNKS